MRCDAASEHFGPTLRRTDILVKKSHRLAVNSFITSKGTFYWLMWLKPRWKILAFSPNDLDSVLIRHYKFLGRMVATPQNIEVECAVKFGVISQSGGQPINRSRRKSGRKAKPRVFSS